MGEKVRKTLTTYARIVKQGVMSRGSSRAARLKESNGNPLDLYHELPIQIPKVADDPHITNVLDEYTPLPARASESTMGPPLTMLPRPMWAMDVAFWAVIVVSLHHSLLRIGNTACRTG
jgi:hypothetical protein